MKGEAWIVVADEAYARIFKLEAPKKLEELTTLIHPESRLHEREMVSDRPGRTFESHTVARRSLGQPVSPKKQEAINFSKVVANYLNEAALSGRCVKIYLAASPAFLGLLRQELNKAAAQMVETEINKTITHLDTQEICNYFPFAHP
ncbi:MAG: host attachment protein [Parachlamydiaceae bacterium]